MIFLGKRAAAKGSMDELIIYEMHVRGFTKMAEDVEHPGHLQALRRKSPI